MPPAHLSTQHDRELCEVARNKYSKEVQDAGGQNVMDTTSHNSAGTRFGGASCFSAWAALRPVAMLRPQDFFGEDALLTGTHTAAVLTDTPCELAWVRPADMSALDRIGISQLLRYGGMRHAWRSGRRHRGPDLYHQSALRQTATETGELSLSSNSAQRLEAELLQHAIAMGRLQREGTMWAASAVTALRAAHAKAKGRAADVEDRTSKSKDQVRGKEKQKESKGRESRKKSGVEGEQKESKMREQTKKSEAGGKWKESKRRERRMRAEAEAEKRS
ncbi:hypothetical protein DUNSADRAFT_11107 [Dunaliella salina]|uniref:Cyclic nucleotide-binding domain-containing protein n=1 Tax=Dunaliella salina TaxID=3046 RepID=A0ABQ7H4K8_DUNSA|nr:hypothetical protein DUNSADRAFT_11107 [Dunaliella salina]|eukprot:KAF5841791.1 hypothetical protein DUNSADRAFT_11107 [Dunaliella salina]